MANNTLSTKMVLYLMSRYTKLLGFAKDDKATRSKIIVIVIYLQPLKAGPEPEANNFVIYFKISLIEKSLSLSLL